MSFSPTSLKYATYLRGRTTDALATQRGACEEVTSRSTDPPLESAGIERIEPADADPAAESSALDQLMQEAAKARFQVIVLAGGTHLSRNSPELVSLIWECLRLDVSLIFANDRFATEPKLHQQLFPADQ